MPRSVRFSVREWEGKGPVRADSESGRPVSRDLDFAKTPVFILAGGRGTRLAGVADEPKAIVPVRGRPFLLYLLASLHREGFRAIHLLTGYRSERVEEVLAEERTGRGAEFLADLNVSILAESSPQGTGGALRPAKDLVVGAALLLNGDSYCAASYAELLAQHARTRAAVSLTVVQVDDAGEYGRVLVEECSGLVRGFAEKESADPAWINAGVYALTRRFLESIPSRPSSLEKEILPDWVARREVTALLSTAYFRDIGTPQRLAAAETEFPPDGLAGLV